MAYKLPPPEVYPKNYKESTPQYKRCGACEALIPYDSKKCASCGGEFGGYDKTDWTTITFTAIFVVSVIMLFIRFAFF